MKTEIWIVFIVLALVVGGLVGYYGLGESSVVGGKIDKTGACYSCFTGCKIDSNSDNIAVENCLTRCDSSCTTANRGWWDLIKCVWTQSRDPSTAQNCIINCINDNFT